MATKTIDIILNMQPDAGSVNKTKAGVKSVEKSLKDVEAQANRTREKMEKLAQVGNKLALVGGAILAPFALSMRKYLDTVKETEPTSKRLVELGKKWEESQVRIGRVTAEIVLPTLEKALDIVDKIAIFAEKNPGAIKAAIGIGATLVVLGGLISTTASVVSTLATIQGLAAAAGIGGGAGAAASLAPLLAAVAPIAIIAGQILLITGAVIVAAEATRQLLNWALGTNQTWADIGTTLKQLFILAGMGWKLIFQKGGEWFMGLGISITGAAYKVITGIGTSIGKFGTGIFNSIKGLGTSLINGIIKISTSISNGLSNLANALRGLLGLPRKAGGGMAVRPSLAGESGREFVMSNRTTRAAESLIGGSLSQRGLLQALASGGGKRVSYYDARRFDASVSANDRRMIRNETMLSISEALK